MKKVLKNNHIMLWFTVLLCSLTIISCSKWDDFTKYTAGGEILYTGKMDSVKIYSGNKRVRFTGLLKADPKITKIKILWNDSADSVVYDIVKGVGIELFDRTFSVDEGIKTFKVFTYDASGNRSVPVSSLARVYGDSYQNALTNRGIEKAEVQANGSALINWADASAAAGIVNMRIKYSDKLNAMHDTLIQSQLTGLTTSLPNFKLGSKISYNTAYLPNPTAIDTFYVAYQDQEVYFDVTSLYLTNVGPFTRDPNSGTGRFGNLGAPWITSANIKNHGGYGGFATDNGGSLVMESGWGGTANIINGKIYQTVNLPAGNYMFRVADYTEALDPVYVVAASGMGLPDISDLSTALGFTKFTSVVRTSETIEVKFTVSQQQDVSLGFLATMVSGNQYWRVTSVKLLKN